MFLRDSKEVRQFLRLAAKTPSCESLESWFASLGLADRESIPAPKETGQLLSEEWTRTGFGPECHLDEQDPNYQTRTVI